MIKLLVPEDWKDYELIDSGERSKLERFGQFVTVRPDPRAIWEKAAAERWTKADAVYVNDNWKFRTNLPTPWQISYGKLKFNLKPTEFKHIGVFPEQAVNWEWISKTISGKLKTRSSLKILNLFAYTGGATMAAAANAGAQVTHVDSSKPSMMWAGENANLALIPKDRIRWIQEDALKFVKREQRRGVKYDGIIMDPPRFGRGAKGEVWKLLDNLPELVKECKLILSPNPLMFLINAYTADVSSVVLGNLLEETMKVFGGSTESGELGLKESLGNRILPAGIFARWSN